jgi:cytochrome oxidase Cu insertion factor (SCO1/SenC/PrrC family)
MIAWENACINSLWKFLGVATREERRHPSHLLAHSHFIYRRGKNLRIMDVLDHAEPGRFLVAACI